MTAAIVQQLLAFGGSVVTTLLAAWAQNHFKRSPRKRLRRAARAVERTPADAVSTDQEE